MEKIGDRIAKAVKNSGLSQKDFAEKIGLTEQSIGNYIKNRRNPSTDALLKMKQMFGFSLDWLISGENSGTNVSKEEIKLPQAAEHQETYQKALKPVTSAHREGQITFLQSKIEDLQDKIQLLQENKALLERENQRLKEQESNHIQELEAVIKHLTDENYAIKAQLQNKKAG